MSGARTAPIAIARSAVPRAKIAGPAPAAVSAPGGPKDLPPTGISRPQAERLPPTGSRQDNRRGVLVGEFGPSPSAGTRQGRPQCRDVVSGSGGPPRSAPAAGREAPRGEAPTETETDQRSKQPSTQRRSSRDLAPSASRIRMIMELIPGAFQGRIGNTAAAILSAIAGKWIRCLAFRTVRTPADRSPINPLALADRSG